MDGQAMRVQFLEDQALQKLHDRIGREFDTVSRIAETGEIRPEDHQLIQFVFLCAKGKWHADRVRRATDPIGEQE